MSAEVSPLTKRNITKPFQPEKARTLTLENLMVRLTA